MNLGQLACFGVVVLSAFAAPGNAAPCLFQPDHCSRMVAFLDAQETPLEKDVFENFFVPIALEQLEREKSGTCTTFSELANADNNDGLSVSQRSLTVHGFGAEGKDVRPIEMKLIRQELLAGTMQVTYCTFLLWKEII